MLQKLNERIQGVVAWVVVSIIALTFALFGVDSYIQARHTSLVEAEVNGKPISKQALDVRYRRIQHEQAASGKVPGPEKQVKRELLDYMIGMQVNLNAAHDAGFGVNTAQVNTTIFQIPQLQEDGHFSSERYEQTLNNALYTPQSFQKEIHQSMLLNQQHFAFLGTAFALPNEIEKFIKLYGQTRDYRYIQIPSSAFSKGIAVSDQEIKTYYESHTHDFLTPEQVSLEFVTLSMAAVREKLNPSETELKAYYENNQVNYMAPAKWQVRHILFEIPKSASDNEEQAIKTRANVLYQQLKSAPDAFEAQSKILSDTKQKDIKTGVLPWVVAGESPLDSAFIQLTEVGQILPPLKTEAGYELFQLQAYEPATLKALVDVKVAVREHWLAEQAQANYARLLEELADQSYQMPDSLTPVAEALKLPIEETGLFTRDTGKDAMTSSPKVLKAAFSHDVLELGNNSAPIQLNDDSVIVLRVKKHIPKREKALSEVLTQIKEALVREKAQARAEALGRTLQSNKQGSFMDEALLLKQHLTWKTATHATRESSLAPADINELAFTLSHAGSRAGQTLPNDAGYVVVELKDIVDGKLSMLDSEQMQSISEQIAANYGTIEYDLYASNLLEQAKIVRH